VKVKAYLSNNPVGRAHQAARTCYFSGSVELDPNLKHSAIADDCVKTKHLSVHQHTYVTLEIEGISRFFCSAILYSQPYYQASQQSLRYVKLDSILSSSDEYNPIKQDNLDAYNAAFELFSKPVADAYTKIWKSKANTPEGKLEIRRGTQELARYTLPIGTLTNLTYTVDLVTLAQILACCEAFGGLGQGKLYWFDWKQAKEFRDNVLDSIEERSLHSFNLLSNLIEQFQTRETNPYIRSFSLSLAQNPCHILLGELSSRVQVFHAEDNDYISAKLTCSHAVFCQLQRHRSIKPKFSFNYSYSVEEYGTINWHYLPSFMVISPVKSQELSDKFLAIIQNLYETVNKDRLQEVNPIAEFEKLPLCTAQNLSFHATVSEVSSLASKRLCLRAQNEATRVILSLNEAYARAEEIDENKLYFKAPCTYNAENDIKPICPEGKRFCGVTVWKDPKKAYENLI